MLLVALELPLDESFPFANGMFCFDAPVVESLEGAALRYALENFLGIVDCDCVKIAFQVLIFLVRESLFYFVEGPYIAFY